LRGTIFLRSNDLVFSKNLIIHGPGAGILTISGGNTGHIVDVLDGTAVIISDLSFKNSNTGKTKYAFLKNDGTLTLSKTTVADNTSSGNGGGIFNNTTSRLTLIDSTVSRNSAQSAGGGIFDLGTLTVINSTISGNKVVAQDASGAGIFDLGPFTLINSTVSGNTSTATGGGITFFGSRATITSCTIYGNMAKDGGGFSIQDRGKQHPHVEMGNSLVAGNHAHIGADISGTLTSDGYNLIQDVSQATVLYGGSAPAELIGMSPNVGPLQDNGGPTKTHALVPGSPAIDKIPHNACHLDAIPTDQRGVKRPQGSKCDIGAYEEVSPHS